MESFFLTSSSFDEVELKELLLRRYHSLDFIKDFDLWGFIKFANLAREKDQEEKIYMRWCAQLPKLAKFMTFKEFKDALTGANIDMRPKEVIIAEIEEAHKRMGERG